MPVTGHVHEVYDELVSIVEEIAADSGVRNFYIGRTVDLEQTLSRHGCDEIHPIYETSSVDYALSIEGALIDDFIDHWKNWNDANSSGGGISDEYQQIVYVAVWYK